MVRFGRNLCASRSKHPQERVAPLVKERPSTTVSFPQSQLQSHKIAPWRFFPTGQMAVSLPNFWPFKFFIFRIISPVLSGKWVWQSQTRCDIMSNGDWNINFKRVLFRLTASGVPPPGAVIFLYLFRICSIKKPWTVEVLRNGTDGTDAILLQRIEKKIKEKEYIGNRRFICTICSKTLIYLCF